jgi:phosphate transport system substrate-binding protein
MHKTCVFIGLATVLGITPAAAGARDYISIVGSSTVYPFATVVAERFGKSTGFRTPKIESTGSGGGLKLFCAGVGVEHPDITNASRRIKQSELDTCSKNGVNEVVEVNIGFDGIALANAKDAPQFAVTRKDLYLALARDIPDADGKLVPNPNKTWKDVNAALPAMKIEVLGPPPTSGTRDAFAELAMEGGCKQIPAVAALKKTDKKAFEAACMTVREDGAYIEAGENDNLIVNKLVANHNALGIFGYSFLEQNKDKVQGSKVDDTVPDFATIADGSYPLSRPLFFYVKKAHVGSIPGIAEYVAEFVGDPAVGEYGYLGDRGLIPLPDADRRQVAADARAMNPMKL